MSTSSSDGDDGKPRSGGVGNVFQRALESRPGVAARGAGEGDGDGERVDVPTCPNCGAPRERERENERAAQPGPATCRYCGERM